MKGAQDQETQGQVQRYIPPKVESLLFHFNFLQLLRLKNHALTSTFQKEKKITPSDATSRTASEEREEGEEGEEEEEEEEEQ